MLLTEKNLLIDLNEAEKKKKEADNRLLKLRKQLMDAETLFIEASLEKERAVEKLRVFRNSQICQELDAREQEIAGFRERHPELIIKNNGD